MGFLSYFVSQSKRVSRFDVIICVVFYVLNLFDMFMTINMSKGMFEWNPLMRMLLDVGDWAFIAFKVVVPAIASVLFVFMRFGKVLNFAFMFSVIVYFFLSFYHVAIFWSNNR